MVRAFYPNTYEVEAVHFWGLRPKKEGRKEERKRERVGKREGKRERDILIHVANINDKKHFKNHILNLLIEYWYVFPDRF